jgi:isochorismate pyruvate lyase
VRPDLTPADLHAAIAGAIAIEQRLADERSGLGLEIVFAGIRARGHTLAVTVEQKERERMSDRVIAAEPGVTDSAELGRIRGEMDDIDRQIVGLLAQRGRCVERAARLKQNQAAVRGPQARVEQIVANARSNAQEFGLLPEIADRIYRTIIAAFIDAELQTHASLKPQQPE